MAKDTKGLKIGAVSTLLNKIKSLDSLQEGYARFYRGQDVSFHPNPSIFRNKGFIDNEHKMFYDVINQKPEEFSNCKCTFDYLVKMQHYELPTRLLDITSNPLVALYFACSGSGDSPTFFYIDVPIWLVKNYQSDSVTILSTLSKYPRYYKDDLEIQVQVISKLIDIYYTELNQIESELINNIEYFDFNSFVEVVKERIANENTIFADMFFLHQITQHDNDEIIKNNIKQIVNRLHQNKRERIIANPDFSSDEKKEAVLSILGTVKDSRLLHEIYQDKPYFQDCMQYHTFQHIYCVQPKLDNTRIISQSGSFLLFPKQMASEAWGDIKCSALSINIKKKKSILDDLSLLNIKNDTMFGELDKVCGYVKSKYKKE